MLTILRGGIEIPPLEHGHKALSPKKLTTTFGLEFAVVPTLEMSTVKGSRFFQLSRSPLEAMSLFGDERSQPDFGVKVRGVLIMAKARVFEQALCRLSDRQPEHSTAS